MRIAYFDCFSGISGDMTIGAFLDAGLSMDALTRELRKLKVGGYTLKKSKTARGPIAGTKFDCMIQANKRHTHMTVKELLAFIEKSSLERRVKDIAKNIFLNIGRAEAKVHGIGKVSGVRFHELAEIDSVVDIVGTAIAIDELGIDEVYSSDITMGRTVAVTSHGRIPIPGPAALELLKGVPSTIAAIDTELVTPTGAGIIKTLARGFGTMPRMKIKSIGYGAGAADLQHMPNMLRIVIGEAAMPFKEDTVTVIETNIDDMSPQNFEYLFERLFEGGALDVYATTIQMKKTRPAFKLTVISEPPRATHLAEIIFRETTSIGVRYYNAGRFKLGRKIVKARTRFGNIDVKVSFGPAGIKTVSPEYDDCVRLARIKKVPFRSIYEEAKNAIKG